MKSLDELLKMNENERAEYLYEEAKKLGKRLDPVYEEIIKVNPEYACWYAENIIKDRWKEAEPYIIKNPEWIYEYCLNVIKGRWPEAEPYIMKDYWAICKYAVYIIKGRWPEAEEILLNISNTADIRYLNMYVENIIKGRWPEAEPIIYQDIESTVNYMIFAGLLEKSERYCQSKFYMYIGEFVNTKQEVQVLLSKIGAELNDDEHIKVINFNGNKINLKIEIQKAYRVEKIYNTVGWYDLIEYEKDGYKVGFFIPFKYIQLFGNEEQFIKSIKQFWPEVNKMGVVKDNREMKKVIYKDKFLVDVSVYVEMINERGATETSIIFRCVQPSLPDPLPEAEDIILHLDIDSFYESDGVIKDRINDEDYCWKGTESDLIDMIKSKINKKKYWSINVETNEAIFKYEEVVIAMY